MWDAKFLSPVFWTEQLLDFNKMRIAEKDNGTQHKIYLCWVFKFKLGCFIVTHEVNSFYAQPLHSRKLCPGFVLMAEVK